MEDKYKERLRLLGARCEGYRWACTQPDPRTAWENCEHAHHMIWVADRLKVDGKLIVMVACRCARLALSHVRDGDDRPLKAIEAAEAWMRGTVTIEELWEAEDVAVKATTGPKLLTSEFAAAAAAYAAVKTAIGYDSTVHETYAFAFASNAATYASEAVYFTKEEVQAKCANITREVIPYSVIEALIEV